VRQALLRMDGVVSATVSYDEQRAFSSRRRCETARCQFVGRRLNQLFLALATLIVAIALLLRLFPSWTAQVIEHL
jgi:hypothetical protein